MKQLTQILWIMLFTFLGELLEALIPLPVPAGIYGLLLLFTALCTKILPLSAVKQAASYLLSIMTILFLPATVGLMETWPILKPVWLPFLVICVVSTVLVMVVSGWTAQLIIRAGRKKEEKK